MKVSLKWLSEYTAVPEDLKAFCDRLDLTGTGVEGVEKTGEAFEGVVVGHVLTCEPHPDSDHMHVVTVDVGAEEPVQIVCGAPNIAADIKVPVALVGAVLPGDFKIKKSKLRGVVSCGMCCSRRELGLGQDHSGIWVLPADAPVGQPMADFMGAGDTVLDLEITPNRPDCLSMVGMAREVGAMYQQPVTWPLAAAKRWAAVTRSGHMVQERETRICRSTGARRAWMACSVAPSRACPGPAALYSPRTKAVNSWPPGTPWKAKPVQLPSGRHTRTQGGSGSCPVVVKVSWSVSWHRACMYASSSRERGVPSRVSSSTRDPVIRRNTVWSWASISGGKRASPGSAGGAPSAGAGGRTSGGVGRRPVRAWAAAAYFSSSVAASAPSPTAGTTWRRGFWHTSPAA